MTVRELQWLVGHQEPPCISIQLPTHRHRPGSEQDPIRYRGLLRKAGELLGGSYTAREAKELLAPLEALDNATFWRHSADGLAVFSSPEVTVFYRLPVPLGEVAVVSDTFHTKPLLRYLHTNRHYYVLSISKNSVSLHGGTPHDLEPVDISSLPLGLEDALGKGPEGGRDLTVRGGLGAGQSPVFHGHGPGDEERKEELARYFRAIDRAIVDFLRDETAPLVLAGVAYYHPIYREVSRYPYLLSEGVEGNVERDSAETLRAKAWPLVERVFAEEIEEKLREYQDRAARRRASDDLDTVARAASHGRVRDLFVCEDRHLWGRLDRESGELFLREAQVDAEDADVLDDLAEMVLLCGGVVWVLRPDQMPGGAPVAAIFRY
jgi:hypothetical protein